MAVFWFMMQIAMIAGFFTSLPANAWLIRKGWQEKMSAVDPDRVSVTSKAAHASGKSGEWHDRPLCWKVGAYVSAFDLRGRYGAGGGGFDRGFAAEDGSRDDSDD